MKRKNNLYHLISHRENLCIAFKKASRGKQFRPEVLEFRDNFETNINKLRQQLLNHQPDVGNYYFFRVRDPKPRDICAAFFPERVLHHAIMNICEPTLETYAIYDSYACRCGKGTLKALHRAQQFAGNNAWYLKMDIKKYFNSIDQFIMLRLLGRRFKDPDLLILLQQILETYHTAPGKGLPIGNLISQHLANFYLGPMDHWIKNELRIKPYLRYMDDFVVFAQDKRHLKTVLKQIKVFLNQELKLELKDNTQLNQCSRGLPFLGMRVFPDRIMLSPRSKRRFVIKLRQYEKKWKDGKWDTETLIRHTQPLIAFTQNANAVKFRQQIIQRFGVLS